MPATRPQARRRDEDHAVLGADQAPQGAADGVWARRRRVHMNFSLIGRVWGCMPDGIRRPAEALGEQVASLAAVLLLVGLLAGGVWFLTPWTWSLSALTLAVLVLGLVALDYQLFQLNQRVAELGEQVAALVDRAEDAEDAEAALAELAERERAEDTEDEA